LTPSRKLPSGHALASCRDYAIEANRSSSKAEQQRVVAQLERPWGDYKATLYCANARQDQTIHNPRNFHPKTWPWLICPPHAQRQLPRRLCANPTIGTGEALCLCGTNNTLRSCRLTPLQPSGQGVGNTHRGEFGELYL